MERSSAAHADEDVGAKPRGLSLELTLEADGATEDHGERQLAEQLDLKDFDRQQAIDGKIGGG